VQHGTVLAKWEHIARFQTNAQDNYAMKSTRLDARKPKLKSQLRTIRAKWSPREQQRRSERGQRRTEEFIELFVAPKFEGEVWAVGAPSTADLRRLAG
jgi:hypothetical protein